MPSSLLSAVLRALISGIVLPTLFVAPLWGGELPSAPRLLAPQWYKRVSAQVTGLDLTWDGRMIAFTVAPIHPGDCNCLVVLDDAGRELWTTIEERKILGVSLSGDGQYAAIGLLDASVALFSGKGQLLWRGKSVGLPSLAPHGEVLITLNSSGSSVASPLVEVFLPDGKRTWALRRKGGVWRAAISDQQDILLSLWSGEIILIDHSRRLAWQQSFPPGVMALAISPEDANYLAIGTGVLDQGLHLFERTGRLLWRRALPAGATEVSLAREGEFVLSYSNTIHGQRLSLYGRQGELLWTYHLQEPATESSKAVIVPHQNMIVAGIERDRQNYVQGFGLAGGLLWVAPVPGPIFDLRVSRDGRYLAAVTDDSLYFFDTQPAVGAEAALSPLQEQPSAR